MAVQFRLAALGHTMEKGRVLEWFVAEGGTIKEGEPLLTVETDKAAVDVDAPISGVILRIVGQVDEEYALEPVLLDREPGHRTASGDSECRLIREF